MNVFELRNRLITDYGHFVRGFMHIQDTGIREKVEEEQQIIAHPPDILLTNYVMLELILTRPQEKPLIAAARHLRFLVLDELHTYRGRQGADVAMLVRRTREAFARVDRYGQPRSTVRVLTYYGTDNPIDGMVIDVLIRKHKTAPFTRPQK